MEHQNGVGAGRFVWRTDATGVLTYVGPEMAAALGAAALQVGDGLEARLRQLACDAADAAADALVANRSWTSGAIPWPLEGDANAATVILGGAPAPGSGGHRGYGLIQERSDVVGTTATQELEQAEQAADESTQALSDADDQVSSDRATLVPSLDGPVEHLRGDVLAVEDRIDQAEEAQRTAEPDRSLDVAAHKDRLPDREVEPTALTLDPGLSLVSNVTHLSGTVGASTSKVIHLSSFKAVAPVLSSRTTPRREPPRVVPEPVPDALDVPRWSEAPSNEPKSADDQRLSSHERFNFDEIARALAALPGADAAGLARSAASREPTSIETASQGLGGSPASSPGRLDGSAAGDAWAVLETLPTGLLVAQADDVVYANRALLDLLGCSSTEELREAGGVDRLFQGLGDLRRPGAAGPLKVVVKARGEQSVEVNAESGASFDRVLMLSSVAPVS